MCRASWATGRAARSIGPTALAFAADGLNETARRCLQQRQGERQRTEEEIHHDQQECLGAARAMANDVTVAEDFALAEQAARAEAEMVMVLTAAFAAA